MISYEENKENGKGMEMRKYAENIAFSVVLWI